MSATLVVAVRVRGAHGDTLTVNEVYFSQVVKVVLAALVGTEMRYRTVMV